MSVEPSSAGSTVRTAEVVAALSLATDLGMGFPFEHGLQATLVTMRLAEALEVDDETAAETFYASLLMYTGCTADADISTRIFGSGLGKHMTHVQFGSAGEAFSGVLRAIPPPGLSSSRTLYETARGLPDAYRFRQPHFASLCEVAEMIAERLSLPASVTRLFFHLTERWDGKSVLRRAEAEDVPLSLRIVHVGRDASYQRLVGGDEHAVAVIAERGGRAFDPDVAQMLVSRSEEIFEADRTESAWEATLAAEPRSWLQLDEQEVDRALGAFGDFADLVAPSFSGHSSGVTRLVMSAGERLGLNDEEMNWARRAAMVHDVGRTAVHPAVWQKPGRLDADAWEQVRLHAYHTQRVLSRSEFLSPLGELACSHHERMDGSGYHRGLSAPALSPLARLLVAADSFQGMTESRAHRRPLTPGEAADELAAEASRGCQDPEAVSAVLEAAGEPSPQFERPAGLTAREAQVISLLARGQQTKQVARTLDISIKTADRHIQNAYRKMGVSTRAGATLFAMEHGLAQSGGLPISVRGGAS